MANDGLTQTDIRNPDIHNHAVPERTLPPREPSLGELFTELSDDMSTLIRKEVELARTETMEKVSQATRSVVYMVAGGLLAYAGLITLLIAAAIALGSIMPYWLSSLIVGVAVIVIGAIFISVGRNSLQNMDMAPQKTIETLREDAKWAKEQVR
jgi:hypothetical protein